MELEKCPLDKYGKCEFEEQKRASLLACKVLRHNKLNKHYVVWLETTLVLGGNTKIIHNLQLYFISTLRML
jgi:hypothetical protein